MSFRQASIGTPKPIILRQARSTREGSIFMAQHRRTALEQKMGTPGMANKIQQVEIPQEHSIT